MNLDVHTLAIFVGITNLLQVISLLLQSHVDKTHSGPGWSRTLIIHKTPSVKASAYFLAAVFLAYGGFFTVRVLTTVTGTQDTGAFTPSQTQTAMYMATLIASVLWTFGFIIMVNQRLNAENREAKEHFELIFNTSPDAVLILRFTDNYAAVDINDGFIELTGFSRDEVIGKSTREINLWKNPEDLHKIAMMLQEKGYCENMEAVFQGKEGRQIVGMVSAKIITLLGIPHIISVIRDITERKQVEEHMRQLVHQLEIEKGYAEKSAITDGLTKLANRRYFDEALSAEFYRSKRSGDLLSLVMLDIDHFKQFNDTYGHLAGDECLRQVALAIKSIIRRSPDIAARYGGEEFVVILPNTDLHGAAAVAENIRKAVEELAIPHTASLTAGYVTVSLGVATISAARVSSPETVLAVADEALYSAKQKGRNRVEEKKFTGLDDNMAYGKADFVRLVWNITNECGNQTIDEQHRKLFETANELLSAVVGGHPKEECIPLMESLLTEVVNHFRDEEAIFRTAQYPAAEEHAQCHNHLASQAAALSEKFGRDELTLGELFSFLAHDVVARHMFTEDRKFIPYILQA